MFFNLIRVMTILVFLSWKEREMRSICYCSCNRDAVWVDSLFHPRVLFSVAFKMKLKVPCLVDCSISIPRTHTHRYICLYCSQRLNFGPEPCLSSELPSAVEWNKMDMPVFPLWFQDFLSIYQCTHLSSHCFWPAHQLMTTFPIKSMHIWWTGFTAKAVQTMGKQAWSI